MGEIAGISYAQSTQNRLKKSNDFVTNKEVTEITELSDVRTTIH